MAFTQYPDHQFIKTIDTSEILSIGGIQVTESMELSSIRPCIYKNGISGGSEQLRLRVHSSSDTSINYAVSNWIDLSVLELEATEDNFFSFVRFDFNRKNINKNSVYYLSLETANYTRNGDTFYLGVPYDYLNTIYTADIGSPAAFNDHILTIQVFGYK